MGVFATALRGATVLLPVMLVLSVLPAVVRAVAADAPRGRPLGLGQAERMALASQPVLRGARAATEAASGRVEQARAGYLPQVTANATYQRTTGNFAPRPGATNVNVAAPPWSDTMYNFFNFGVTASQLVYDFGQTSGRWRAADAARMSVRAQEAAIEHQVILAVRRAYFQARAQEDLLQVSRETLANQEKHLNQIQQFVAAGLRPDIDLARVRTDVANARAAFIFAENGRAIARAILNQTMGVRDSREWVLSDDALPPVPGEDDALDPLVEAALAARPEMIALERQRRAQEATLLALRGGFGPSLGVTGSASEAGRRIDGLVPNWSVGAALTWPLLQGGLNLGLVREARANLDNVLAQQDALRLQVGVEVEQAQLSVKSAKAGVAAADEARSNATDQLRLAEGRYGAGLGSVIELGDAQVAFTSAAAQSVQAHYNVAAARALLVSALGRASGPQ